MKYSLFWRLSRCRNSETFAEKAMKPFVSIIIPTYNCRPFLEEGLVSVLEQLPEDYELIVVDDGSSDGTLSVLAQYEGRCGNLQVYPREHRGASGARNSSGSIWTDTVNFGP